MVFSPSEGSERDTVKRMTGTSPTIDSLPSGHSKTGLSSQTLRNESATECNPWDRKSTFKARDLAGFGVKRSSRTTLLLSKALRISVFSSPWAYFATNSLTSCRISSGGCPRSTTVRRNWHTRETDSAVASSTSKRAVSFWMKSLFRGVIDSAEPKSSASICVFSPLRRSNASTSSKADSGSERCLGTIISLDRKRFVYCPISASKMLLYPHFRGKPPLKRYSANFGRRGLLLFLVISKTPLFRFFSTLAREKGKSSRFFFAKPPTHRISSLRHH